MRHALVSLGGAGDKPPLYCVHPIGGHVGEYVRLAEQLDRPVVGIASRGIHDAREEHASIASMIADYADAIAESPGPYYLFGWSLGGMIAHGVACHLERRGAPVALVGMVDPPPAMPVPAADERAIAIAMALAIFHPSPPPRPVQRRAMQSLPGDPGSLAAWCVAHQLLPADAPLAEVDAAIALFGIHRAMFAGHVSGVCAAPLHVWNARSLVDHDWSQHTTGACTVKAVGGDHFTIMKSPHIDAIATDLRGIA
ncbi:MAG TPA: thioesterase domain-containing protein [Kofleriaceae bacterium]|jgi:thioesterase domain-containing protein